MSPEKSSIETATANSSNQLFPVFLKLDNMRVLLVGGGKVGLEKLNAILQNAPATSIRLVAIEIDNSIRDLAARYSNIEVVEKAFEEADFDGAQVVIVAVNDPTASAAISTLAKQKGKLVNVADKPELCDFYLSSIVQKGNLKIAISTNGKSPTIAKRLKELLHDALPDTLDDILNNMHIIRSKLNGDFAARVKQLDDITKVLAAQNILDRPAKKWRRTASWFVFAFFFMFVGHAVLSYLPFSELLKTIQDLPNRIDDQFYWMVLAGFLAQLVDGALGMGYGVTCASVLLSTGINLPAISGSIHTAEMVSSAASGYSHYRFGNVNKRLVRTMLIPGIIGAVLGALLLSKFGEEYSAYIRPVFAAYTLFLGVKIFMAAFRKQQQSKKVRRLGWLAGAGGFLDSFGGGGWGPLVTSTLISKGGTPRYVIGSVSVTEFFVTLASALTFFSMLGISHWQVVSGLIIGGVVAAPLAARLAGRLPVKTMFIAVGGMVVIWSVRILIKSL
ncbi:MAG TPA: TSUP family transporter [Chitinophagaceae bacterium]|nr:TSUP family transporter [Chitinophagaceae bacterium]